MPHEEAEPRLEVRGHRPEALRVRAPAALRQEHQGARRDRQDQRLSRGAGGGGAMKYLYYPGCSAEATGKAYDMSTRAVMRASSTSSSSSSKTGTAAAPPATSRSASSTRSPSRPATWRSPQQMGDEDLVRHLQRLLHDPGQDQPLHGREPGGPRGRSTRPSAPSVAATTAPSRSATSWTCCQRRRARGDRRPGHAASQQAQGRPVLRLSVLAADGDLRRPRVPDHHGPPLRGARRRPSSTTRPRPSAAAA